MELESVLKFVLWVIVIQQVLTILINWYTYYIKLPKDFKELVGAELDLDTTYTIVVVSLAVLYLSYTWV